MTIFEELQWRGLVQDVSSPEIEKLLNAGGVNFYIGTDPTAESLHLGHYSSFLITKRLKQAGHNPFLLVGVATALVGDPRGTSERELSDRAQVEADFHKLKAQLQSIFPYEVLNNHDWVKDIKVIDYLRDYGKLINVNYMLAKDLINRQLQTGISYAEFSYMMIQGLDFAHLFKEKNIVMQVAGSDQWGNMTTGIEMIRKLYGKEVYAFTMPLITDSTGKKFGKSEGNSMWLDKNMTSPYEMFQYLINSEDEVVIKYLKMLTFLAPDEINRIEKEHLAAPHERTAQKALAREVLCDLHGHDEYEKAAIISAQLFSGNIKGVSLEDLKIGLKGVPTFEFASGNIVDILVSGGICSSKREAREMLANGAISINGDIVKDQNELITNSFSLGENIVVFRKGKKKYFIGKITG